MLLCLHPCNLCRNGSEQENWIINSASEIVTAVLVQQGEVTQGSAPPSPITPGALLLPFPGVSAPSSPRVVLPETLLQISSDWSGTETFKGKTRSLCLELLRFIAGQVFILLWFTAVHLSTGKWDPVRRNLWEYNAVGAGEIGRWQLLCKTTL